MNDSVASRYALALFEIAKEENKVKSYKDELNSFYGLLDKDVLSFLGHFSIPTEAKKNFLEKGFKGKMDQTIYNFICLLLDKNRFNDIKNIVREFNEEANQYLNIEEGIIYSAAKLTSEEVKQIAQKVSKMIGKETLLTQRLDESLVGGFKVCVADKVIDNSLKNKLESLKTELLKEEVNS